jgi:crossover junction endodeoxyribonuclease RuvC
LGIDPGLATVGYGAVEKNGEKLTCLGYGVISTPKEESLPQRLRRIGAETGALLEKYKPDAAAVEELFFNTNVKTAIQVAHARGVLLYSVLGAGCPLFEYTPLQIKQGLTGYGRADKQQVQYMVRLLLKLQTNPKPDDAADALAAALCHAQTNRFSGFFKI